MTNLTVVINRNPTAPRWEIDSYSETVNEEVVFGTNIINLEATDDDGVCCIHFTNQLSALMTLKKYLFQNIFGNRFFFFFHFP